MLRIGVLVAMASSLFAAGWNWEEMDDELMEFPDEFLWQNDVKGFKQNAARLFVEWSLVEPEEGVFDEGALAYYAAYIKKLVGAKITPMVTLHQFRHPGWFEAKGGFEKGENIEYFIRFCKRVFSHLGNRGMLWCTMHEPTMYVLNNYLLEKKDFALGGVVLKNLLKAHCDVYRELKATSPNASIGFSHKYLILEPSHEWNPMESILASIFTEDLHRSVMRFLKDGSFDFYVPIAHIETYENPDGPKSYDFIALQYVPRGIFSGRLAFTSKQDVLDDKFCAEGLYDAIVECSHFGKPVYVTEVDHLDKYLFAISEAISHGVKVRGYFCGH